MSFDGGLPLLIGRCPTDSAFDQYDLLLGNPGRDRDLFATDHDVDRVFDKRMRRGDRCERPANDRHDRSDPGGSP
jgi:hypothetical protein